MNMQQLLQNIVAGHTSFDPSGSSESELRAFQLIAALVLKAEELGYVTDVLLHQESDSGNDYYDTVVVGGITKRGREVAG
ncbi:MULTISPECIES: hypothetical protein [Stenotrophomonas]|uniref:hypothetical protein n=1 Tax=Stenotrophomonas TaxID=40323 RepID=UPI00077012C3|nr:MULTISPECIES: hypothetical protein [Stenotrophomonas]AMJ58482.1 hypothetical protein AXG53_19070 [Stenotrophomonas sp. KCTC 12332]